MSKYVNGYFPKIEYWSGKLNEAIASLDEDGIQKCTSKLLYFVGKQNSTYGGPLKGDSFLRSIGVIK
jgi:hypothetical protein